MIRADDLQQVDDRLVEWGSHGVSHASLGLAPAGELALEAQGSRDALREMGAGRTRFLAYPNASSGVEVRRAVAKAGYDAAVTVGQREVSPGAERLDITRFDVGGRPAAELVLEITGAVQAARSVRRGRQR
jgi:peptidoglycan/xylan/chitin deacetylase (PgdA/CDA1 family)